MTIMNDQDDQIEYISNGHHDESPSHYYYGSNECGLNAT